MEQTGIRTTCKVLFVGIKFEKMSFSLVGVIKLSSVDHSAD